MSKIMIVDDDEYIRELVAAFLKGAGFSVCEAANGRLALSRLDKEKPDLCVVDVMMPQMDGFELCKYIRQYHESLPVLILTAKADASQKVKGFTLGADDYLTKPFDPQELVLRVKAILRRCGSSSTIQAGALSIDLDSRSIEFKGEKSDIPLKEFELLSKLASQPGKTFTRSSLIEDIWGYDFEGNERTLDVHINRLRERFQEHGFKITTIRGLGYRLEELK